MKTKTRSKGGVTTVALARQLRSDVQAIAEGFSSPIRWVTVGELAQRHPDASEEAIDAAVALAIEKNWLRGGGTPPHSVCLASGFVSTLSQ